MERNYTVEVVSASKELTAKEKVFLKTSSSLIRLDEVTPDEGKITITPKFFAKLAVHNERAKDDKDYTQFVLVCEEGAYLTGSTSFMDTFCDIYSEMENEEGWQLDVFRLPSKNYKGKTFLTCSLVL